MKLKIWFLSIFLVCSVAQANTICVATCASAGRLESEDGQYTSTAIRDVKSVIGAPDANPKVAEQNALAKCKGFNSNKVDCTELSPAKKK